MSNDLQNDERLQLHGEAIQQQTGELSVTSAAAEASMTIQASVLMARKFPRNEDAVFEALMRSCQRPRFAETASYSFPRGESTIAGASIKLAREAKRLWGNIRTGLEVTFDERGDGTTRDPGLRRIRGWAWDLQTNTYESFEDSFLKLIQRKRDRGTIWVVPDERDLRELTFRRGAICVRNAILALMPPDLIDDARDIANETLETRAKADPEGEKKRLIMGFSRLKVTPQMLEELLGHSLAQASPAEIAELRKVWLSLRDGNTTWPDHVAPAESNDLRPEDVLQATDYTPGILDELVARVTAAGLTDSVVGEYGPPGPAWELNRVAVDASIEESQK